MNYLDRNEFNFKPSQLVVDTIKNFDLSKFAFYTRIYDQGKKSIFSVFLSEQFQVDEQQVLLGYGAEDLLKKAVHFFLTEEGSNRIMMIPKFSWWYYANIAAEVNGKTLQYNVIETDDTFKYDFDSLERQVNEVRPKILLVATPNNPTGNGLTPTELEHLCDIVPKETVILVDEAYASYVTSDTLYIKHLVETRSNIVFCRTLSKFYGLPGLRLGFGFIGKGDEMERFAKYANMYLGYDRLSEEVGIAALKSSDHYREIARVMQEARDMYTKEIGKLKGFKVYKSVANFILIKYPIHLKEMLQQAFADEDYKVKFMNEPDLNTHMRITLGRAEQNRTICDTILRIAHQ
jgi:histidinol-phosphate aminotransferase